MAVFKGHNCAAPTKHILTETEGRLGPVVDIRMKGKAWYYYDPARPVGGSPSRQRGGCGPGQWSYHDARWAKIRQTRFTMAPVVRRVSIHTEIRKVGTVRKRYPTREERTLPPTSVRRKSRP